MNELPRREAALRLVVIVAALAAVIVVGQVVGLGATLDRRWPALSVIVRVGAMGAIQLALVAAALRRSGQTWADIGAGRPRDASLWVTLGIGLLAVPIVYVVQAMVVGLWVLVSHADLARVGEARRGWLASFRHVPLAAVLPISLFAGLCEELMFRGLIFSRLRALVRSPDRQAAVAIVGSSALFALGHAYQGGLGMLQTFTAGVLFAALTYARKSLWPAVIAHAGIDTLSLLAVHFLLPIIEQLQRAQRA